MLKTIFLSIFLLFSVSICYSQTGDQLTVFGYKLGEAFSIPEYKYQVGRGQRDNVPIFDPTKDCFMRKSFLNIKKKDIQEGKLPPITNEVVTVVFASSTNPNICVGGKFDATVQNSKIVNASFDIPSGIATHVFQLLKKKYGDNCEVENYKFQNGYGAGYGYYVAKWTFPHMSVIFESSKHRSLQEHDGDVAIFLQDNTKNPNKSNRSL
jgi:hypothetical protein